MKRTAMVIGALVLLSAILYLAQYFLFRRPVDSEFYLMQDLAFLPINVLLVSLGLNEIISSRERKQKLNQINILIGEFFSEAGNDVIRLLNPFVANLSEICICIDAHCAWDDKRFDAFVKRISSMEIRMDVAGKDLAAMRDFLRRVKPRVLAMFENPNLLEHDRFTDMLWALYHLIDELSSRDELSGLARVDLDHLAVDMARAYALLVVEWAYIMKHMKEKYPYLYSMAVRKNPFAGGSAVIQDNR